MPTTYTQVRRAIPSLFPAQILHYLDTHPGPVHYRVLAKACQCPKLDAIVSTLHYLTRDGRVQRVGVGMYRLGTYQPSRNVGGTRPGWTPEAVRACYARHAKPLHYYYVATLVSISPRAAGQIAARLARAGVLRRTGRGMYTLAKKGK